MRQPYLVVGTLLVGLLLGGGAVVAQEEPGRLPGSVLGAQGTLTGKDLETVTGYVDYWVKQLQSDDPERVAAARGRLIEPYNQGGTESFVSQYDQLLANKIETGLQSKHIFGRMNTGIVAQKIRHAKVADVIKAGLKQEASAVLYQFAVATEAFAKQKTADNAAKFGLVKPIADAMKKEKSPFVLEYLYRALAEIENPAGWEEVMTKINGQLNEYVANPDMGLDAELEGARAVYGTIIRFNAAGGKVPDKTLHLFLLMNVRTMDVVLRTPAADRSATQQTLLSLADAGAIWAANALNTAGANIKVPPSMKNKTDDESKLYLGDWKKILAQEPMKFADGQISVAKPKTP